MRPVMLNPGDFLLGLLLQGVGLELLGTLSADARRYLTKGKASSEDSRGKRCSQIRYRVPGSNRT